MANDYNSRIAVGIDVGTSKVAIAIGEYKENLTNVIGMGVSPNSGLRRGVIIDPEEVVSSLSAAVEEARKTCDFEIRSAVLGVGGTGIKTVRSRGVVAITHGDSEINQNDVEAVIESAKSVALPPNYEPVQIIPEDFVVDGGDPVSDPTGMRGMRLEGEILVTGVPSAQINNIIKIINQIDISAEAIILNPLASARAVLNKKQKEQGVMLLDIGAGTTGYCVYEEGELVDTNIIPIGSSHITNDIAIGLKTTLEIAEKIKCQHLNVDETKIRESETIDLSKISGGEEGKISKVQLAEIADARLKEIFGFVRKELKHIKKDMMLPAGVVLTGGGSNLEGIVHQARLLLDLPAQKGNSSLEVGGTFDKIDDPSYATSIGLMLTGLEMSTQEGPNTPGFEFNLKKVNLGGLTDKAKKLFKHFLP